MKTNALDPLTRQESKTVSVSVPTTAGDAVEGARSKTGCPLCGRPDGECLERIRVADLEHEYRRLMGVTVREEFPSGLEWLSLWRCDGCGLEYFDPLVTGSETFYARLGRAEPYYSKTRWEFTETLRQLEGDPELIDVGCGDGYFLRLVPGVRRWGIEYNPDAARRARESGLRVEERGVETLASGSADVLTVFQVLEHVREPRGMLEALVRVLRAGGRLFVAVPNNDNWVGDAPPNPLNAPPHHVLRWRAEALRQVPQWTGLVLEELLKEPLAEEHLYAYRRARILRAITSWWGGRMPRYGIGVWPVFWRRLATALTEVSIRCDGKGPARPGTGHSLLAVYRKPG